MVAGVILLILGVGCLVGGSILCWQSTIQATCADWEQVTGYVGTQCRDTVNSACAGCGGLAGNATQVRSACPIVPQFYIILKTVYMLWHNTALRANSLP